VAATSIQNTLMKLKQDCRNKTSQVESHRN
jgi:hypothetical protein